MTPLRARLPLVLLALVVAAAPAAHAQDGTFFALFDMGVLPDGPTDARELGEALGEAFHLRYEGEEPVEAVVVAAWVRDGEVVGEIRTSQPFQARPGGESSVTNPENMARLFYGRGVDDTLFPDSTFFPDTIFFPDGHFVPEGVRKEAARHGEWALFVAAVPAEEDARERIASRPAVVVFGSAR